MEIAEMTDKRKPDKNKLTRIPTAKINPVRYLIAL
ncbi:MAG: hypothetical protein JWP78_29 [Mucilaginibacter sp.]|nr:hypothetical protein [Mucilaginibacter sp.]